MNISSFASAGSVYTNCEYIKGYAFKNAAPRVESTYLTVRDVASAGNYGTTVSIFGRCECLSPCNS